MRQAIGELLALVVHDLRNPVATVSANISFVKEVGITDEPDAKEAMDDVETAIGDLMRGLDQLSWIGRWFAGQRALEGAPGDVRAAIDAALRKIDPKIEAKLPSQPLPTSSSGAALTRLIELLVRNSLAYAPAGS